MELTTYSCSTPESVFDEWFSETHPVEEEIPDFDTMDDKDEY